ncbi:MAG: alpha/beta fold hydrolase [Deltaproteobacteria bacterium]|nr:alpha/beta fold hydrolase [Deltaproteobacteria bacterium]
MYFQNGVDLYYEVHGQGDPLVLIAGLTAHSGHWPLQVPVFAEKRKIILMDNRNAGRSAVTQDGGIPVMADDVAALMDKLGISRADILGRSMGGYIAQEVAIRHPSRVRRLILESTAPVSSVRNIMLFEHLLSLMERDHDQRAVLAMFFLWENSPSLMADPELFAEALEDTMADPHAQPLEGFRHQVEAIRTHDTRGRLDRISAPCLIIGGAQDLLIPVEEQKDLVESIPDTRWVCLQGAGHGVHADQAERFNNAVLDFLA